MLSEALRLIRVFHDVKQIELAQKLGVSKSYISEIESGKKNATIEIVSKYSLEFNIPISSIMFFSEEIGNKNDKFSNGKLIISLKILNFLKLIEMKTQNND